MAGSRIAVVGSVNTDMILRVPRIPQVGETIHGGQFLTAAGGKGANQAVAASRAGGRVAFVARVGRDSFGDRALKALGHDRIDVTRVFRDGVAPSGVALILLDRTGQNSIAVAAGANHRLSVADIRKSRSTIASAQTLLLQLETPLNTVRAAAHLASRKGVRVILNPAPAQALPTALLKHVSIITPNESEAELLTGIKVTTLSAAKKAAEALHRLGVPTVILTMGARGALVSADGIATLVRGFKVKAVDTTAAGDTFNGALAVALTEGQSLLQAVRFANAAAAISVTRLGAQPSVPRRQEISRFLASCHD